MQVLIDGKTIEAEVPEAESLEATLRRVQSDHCAPDRMVVGIRCDNREVSGQELSARLNAPASSVEKLEVLTSTRFELVATAMEQASSALQDTEIGSRRVGDLLSAGKTTEGIQSLGECLNVWQQIHDAVTKSISMLELDIESMTIRDEPLLTVLERPRNALLQIKEALTNQDYVLLADVLQYEFCDVTEQWYSVIAALRQAAEDMQES